MAGFTDVRRDAETPFIQKGTSVFQETGAAADHRPILGRVERWQTKIFENLAAFDQVSQPPPVVKRLSGHGGVIDQLLSDQLP